MDASTIQPCQHYNTIEYDTHNTMGVKECLNCGAKQTRYGIWVRTEEVLVSAGEVEEIEVPVPEHMSASEALYGFCGWITTMKNGKLVGARYDAGFWANLVHEFCKIHNLPEPRKGWEEVLQYPEELRLW